MSALDFSLWADLLGKPWQKDARGPAAYDCVGLLLELAHRRGLGIPEYASEPAGLVLARCQWEHVQEPQPGDGILMFGRPWHIGVVTRPGWMIHASQVASQVLIERYNAFPWHKRIEGFYRWKQV